MSKKEHAGGKNASCCQKNTTTSNKASTSEQLTPSAARCVTSRYLEEPKFEIEGISDYGGYAKSKPPGNRHFIPRRAKLRAAGERHRVNVSVLPPCVNYDLWKHPKWKAMYDKPLDEDPCPDCDVRFTAEDGVYRPKVAPASMLVPCRWRRRQFMDTIILIGLPQHITVAYIKETNTNVYVEYVDPAGPSGDRRGSEEVQLWMHTYLTPRIGKPIKFHQAAKGINFQCDKNDVMCQTWIWYWVYFRLVRNMNTEVLARHVYRLGVERRSLERVHKFNCWLADLYKLGFYISESPSQTQLAVLHTPSRPHPRARAEKKPSRMQVAFQKLMKKTSDNCFSRSYAVESDDESDDDETTATASSSDVTAATEELDEMSVSDSN